MQPHSALPINVELRASLVGPDEGSGPLGVTWEGGRAQGTLIGEQTARLSLALGCCLGKRCCRASLWESGHGSGHGPGRSCCGGFIAFAFSDGAMDEKADSLVMTMHLLAKPGHALPLQQALDKLQEWICLDVRLFLVSERASPVKYYETYHQKSTRFPGTSVLLFLHEDLGEERIFQVHDFFQYPPWQRIHIESAGGKRTSDALAHQGFYGLDEHMPVWGLRQVHYGKEIVRVTLYCSFDNYDDAVRLYEMILQQEATVQKSTFCAFVLYATQSIMVQLCLKQLPVGMCIDSKESSVLQFQVHKIGQLVPLLPNPCVPISSTRWQTEDYEGNRILLQVQGISNHSGHQCSPSSSLKTLDKEEPLCYHASSSLVTAKRTAVTQKNRTLRAMKNKNKSAQSRAHPPGSHCDQSQNTICSSTRSYSPTESSQQDQGTFQSRLATKWRHSSHELWLHQKDEEMNVDTGNRVVSPECSDSPLNRFSKDLEDILLQSCAPSTSAPGADSRIGLHSEGRNSALSHFAKRTKDSGHRASGFDLGTSGAKYRNREEEEEEEFFI
ncbi:protein FAM124B isoform X1 [Anolis carolinensis]|uniref:protein FAM124B isoform X1 n=2 Tax=Anolis carolinensis TaxID=28377 RepID=UPI002F2B20AC